MHRRRRPRPGADALAGERGHPHHIAWPQRGGHRGLGRRQPGAGLPGAVHGRQRARRGPDRRLCRERRAGRRAVWQPGGCGAGTDGGRPARRITGVFVSEEPALLCPAAQEDPAAGATAAYLAGVAANDPRGTVQGVLQAAGLGGADPLLLPYGTLRWVLGVAGTLPLLAAGVRLLEESGAACPAARPCAGARGSAWRSPPRRRCRRFWPRCRAGWCRAAGRISIFGAALPPPPPKPCRACFSCSAPSATPRAARPAAGSRRVSGGRGCGVWVGCRRRGKNHVGGGVPDAPGNPTPLQASPGGQCPPLRSLSFSDPRQITNQAPRLAGQPRRCFFHNFSSAQTSRCTAGSIRPSGPGVLRGRRARRSGRVRAP